MPEGQEGGSPVPSTKMTAESLRTCYSLNLVLKQLIPINQSFPATIPSEFQRGKCRLSVSSPECCQIRNMDIKSVPEEMTWESYLKLQILDNMEIDDVGCFLSVGLNHVYVSPCPCRPDVYVLVFCLHFFSLSFTAWTVVVMRKNIFVSPNCQRWHREAKGMWVVLFCF